MKKLYILSLLLVCLFTANISYAQTRSTNFKFDKNEHNFGEIPQGKPVVVEFSFVNNAKRPIMIQEVKTSCGCTTPFYTKEPIGPGKKGVIKARYNAAAAGDFNKSITVKSNLGNYVLYIRGSVIPKK